MSDSGDPDVTRLLRDLTRELQTLQRELEADSQRRLPTRRQLSRFTSEVAIPGLILILETNIRALKLLRRTIRLAEKREPRQGRSERAASELKDRAERLGETTLARLDETLAEVQTSLEGRDADDDVQEMLTEARQLQRRIREQLDSTGGAGSSPADRSDAIGPSEGQPLDVDESDAVAIDVDEELRNLKDTIENDGENSDGADSDGSSGGDGS